MEGAKTKIILSALVISVIVIASIGFYLIKDAGVDGITAMEGREIADEIALNWNDNATLLSIRKADSGNEGYFDAWFCKYIDTIEITNATSCIEIKIYCNGASDIRYNASYGTYIPLGSGWIIDSNKAYDIAQDSDEIKAFLRHNPYIDYFALRNESGCILWDIEWAYNAGIDDPQWAQIQINANTGEVLYVEADN